MNMKTCKRCGSRHADFAMIYCYCEDCYEIIQKENAEKEKKA